MQDCVPPPEASVITMDFSQENCGVNENYDYNFKLYWYVNLVSSFKYSWQKSQNKSEERNKQDKPSLSENRGDDCSEQGQSD